MRMGKNVKAVKKVEKKTRKARTKTATFRDVMILFLAEGLSVIEKQVDAGKINSKAVVKAAAVMKKDFPGRADMLVAYADKLVGTNESASSGRVAPQVGEERLYKVQQVGNKPPFGLIKLATLSLKRGDKYAVRYEDGQIVITTVDTAKAAKRA